MAIGDVYQVIDTQVADGQKCLNVYFYRVQSESSVDNTAADVCTAFIATVLPPIVAVQSNHVTHTQIEAKNLLNESDAHTQLISETGAAGTGTDFYGTFEAIGFAETGSNHAVKNGAKRIVGVDEDTVTDGIFAAGLTTALTAVAAVLFGELPWGLLAAEALIPVIVKRIKLSEGVYRLPKTSGELVTSDIIGATWNPLVTSQVSRKVGRGE